MLCPQPERQNNVGVEVPLDIFALALKWLKPTGMRIFYLMTIFSVADLRRRPEGAMAPLREETATKKAYKLLLEGTKIIDPI